MGRYRAMTAAEARIWCLQNPKQEVTVLDDTKARYRFNRMAFEMSYDRGPWEQSPNACLLSPLSRQDFIPVDELESKPESKTLEEMYQTAMKEAAFSGYITDVDKCLCRAITRYIEQQLKEVAK